MKQVFLIVMIAASALTVSAQRSYNDANDRYHYKYDGKDRYDLNDRGKYPKNKREFKRQVSNINRDYDTRIAYIRNHPHMRRNEKSRMIDELQMQRRIALQQCRERYMHKDYADRRKW